MKTNFLNKLKQGLFLLIAVLGTFISYAQALQNPTIGGRDIPGTGTIGLNCIVSSPSRTLPMANSTFDAHCIAINVTEVGDQGTSSGTDTGGRDCGGGLNPIYEIGGRNDTGTGQFGIGGKSQEPTIGFTLSDIGGRDSGGGYLTFADIGGRGGSDPGTGPVFDPGGSTLGELVLIKTTDHLIFRKFKGVSVYPDPCF